MITLPNGLGGAKEIKKRFASASERRELWRSTLQDMYEFFNPNRETFNFHSPGQRKNRHLYDSTGVEALQTFVSVITSSITPESTKWMKYEAGSDIQDDEQDAANEALEAATSTFFKYLSHSDFSSQINLSHQDMAISMGCLLVEQGNDIDEPLLKFTAIPLPELYPEPTSMAKVHTVFRKHSIKAQEIMLKFPEAKLNPKQERIVRENPTSDVDIIDGSQVFNFKDKTYHQVVMWDDEIIFHQSYGDSPVAIVYRWSKVSGETYGRGPADMAMADVRTLNKVKEFMLQNAALTMTPPMLGASDGIFNPHSARIQPGIIMPVADTGNPPLVPMQVGGDLRVGQFIMEDMQNNIKKVFFADPLGELSDPVRSATENLIRQQDMLKKRGANFGRLQSEFVFPLVARVSKILALAGKIPPIEVDGREVTLKMSSPLASAEQTENIDHLFVFLNAMQQLPDEVKMLGAALEFVPQFLQRNLNLPEELARSPEQIEQATKMIMQQQQAQQQPQGGPPIE